MNANLVGRQIRELRMERGLNQSQFGKIISVSQDTVSLWEKGKSMPTTELVIDICCKFQISADYLLGLDEYFAKYPK